MNAWSKAAVPYGTGHKAGVDGLDDKGLCGRLARYKRQVAKRYRVLESSQIEHALPKGQLWISPKLDGELWFLVRRAGDLALCAYNGRVLHGIPWLQTVAPALQNAPDFIVAGELVAPIGQGRPRSPHVAVALTDDRHATALAFHPFDLVDDGGVDVQGRAYSERLARLQALFGEARVITTVVGDAAQAASYYREWVAGGHHEGLVARSEQNITFKIKPHLTIDAVVIAYGERLVGDTRQLRELSVALVRDDGSYQTLGTVGTGFSEEDRVAWHQRLGQMQAPSSFRMANSEGTLSRFVRPELVVELRCSDLLDTDADDQPIRRMGLAWDAQSGWTPQGEHVTAVMLHPTFLRERTDKRADAGDCGMTQITSRLPLESDAVIATGPSVKAEILKREVWTKETKGLTAVRKYALIQTNKPTRDWPPLVLFCTDFSPGRAEPLQTSLRTAPTREAADQQIAAWIEENIKKGWNLVGAAPAAAAEPEASEAPRKRTRKTASDDAPVEADAAPKKRARKVKE
jgi:hypothetical protein